MRYVAIVLLALAVQARGGDMDSVLCSLETSGRSFVYVRTGVLDSSSMVRDRGVSFWPILAQPAGLKSCDSCLVQAWTTGAEAGAWAVPMWFFANENTVRILGEQHAGARYRVMVACRR